MIRYHNTTWHNTTKYHLKCWYQNAIKCSQISNSLWHSCLCWLINIYYYIIQSYERVSSRYVQKWAILLFM